MRHVLCNKTNHIHLVLEVKILDYVYDIMFVEIDVAHNIV